MDIRNSTLDDIAAVIGFTATLRLSAWFGDRGNLYVPEVMPEDHTLVKLIGKSPAEKLSKEWGHSHLAVPGITDYTEDLRRREIWSMLSQGWRIRYIAVKVDLTERRVQQICRELEMAGLLPVISIRKTAQERRGDGVGQKRGGDFALANTGGGENHGN